MNNSKYLSTAPYIIKVSNNSDKKNTATLFGYNKSEGMPNNGNDENIDLLSIFAKTKESQKVFYNHILDQSKIKPFSIGKIRFYSENEEMLQKEVVINSKKCSLKFKISDSLDPKQKIKNVVDVNIDSYFDADTYMTFDLEPNSEMTILLYPYYYGNKQVEKNEIEEPIVHNPLVISVENKSDEEKEVVLFDASVNFNKPNYGNDDSIEILNAWTGTKDGYQRILGEILSEPHYICKTVIRNIKTIKNCFNYHIDLIHEKSDAYSHIYPLTLLNHLDLYNDEDIVILKRITLHKNRRMNFNISGKTKMIISLYKEFQPQQN